MFLDFFYYVFRYTMYVVKQNLGLQDSCVLQAQIMCQK